MSDIVSTSNKNQNATTSANHAHDFRSLWNYFFDFSNNDMDNIEPKIDITDNKTSVMVVAEIPGIKEEDIDLKISEDGYLTISGEKQNITEENSKNNYFKEISYGLFKRTIPLPWDLDYSASEAEYENGVLTLRIPKSQTEKQKFKKINIKKKNTDKTDLKESGTQKNSWFIFLFNYIYVYKINTDCDNIVYRSLIFSNFIKKFKPFC